MRSGERSGRFTAASTKPGEVDEIVLGHERGEDTQGDPNGSQCTPNYVSGVVS